MNTDHNPDLAAKIAAENDYRILEIASAKAKVLALLLRGGRKADSNVEKPLALAKELSAWLAEPHRVRRRLFGLSYAAMAGSSSVA